MKELSQEIITKVNNRLNDECMYDQGIFREPQNIPTNIKEPVVYMRWNCGGISGGSCWDSSRPRHYEGDDKPEFKALDYLLEEIYPNITYLTYKKISGIVNNVDYSEGGYYGNRDDYEIEYILVSKLLELLNL